MSGFGCGLTIRVSDPFGRSVWQIISIPLSSLPPTVAATGAAKCSDPLPGACIHGEPSKPLFSIYRPIIPVSRTGFLRLANRVSYGFLNPGARRRSAVAARGRLRWQASGLSRGGSGKVDADPGYWQPPPPARLDLVSGARPSAGAPLPLSHQHGKQRLGASRWLQQLLGRVDALRRRRGQGGQGTGSSTSARLLDVDSRPPCCSPRFSPPLGGGSQLPWLMREGCASAALFFI
jgi:hypothetical protein